MQRVVVRGLYIVDIATLCREFERAVGAAAGSWGRTLFCFDDRLFGGYGLVHPCVVVWESSQSSRNALDSEALALWARERLDASDPLDAEARAWLEQAYADGLAGTRDLFAVIVDALQTVEARSGGRCPLALELA